MTSRNKGKVSLVGAGPGDPGLLTLKGLRALQQADVLLYDYLASAPVVALAPPDCERVYVGKKAGSHTLSQSEITAIIIRLAHEGKNVVRLKGGDPFVFGRGGEEAQELFAAGIEFEVIPGISSALAAPAYAGIPVTHRAHNTAFTVITGHEDPSKDISSINWKRFADPHQTLILLMAMGNLNAIVVQLLSAGMPADTPVAIIREGTRPSQATLVGTLETIVAEVARMGFSAPSIVVVGGVVKLREEIAWYEKGALFGKRLLITRPTSASDAFAMQLWEMGVEPILAPTISIEPPDDMKRARIAVEGAGSYAWIVFTSRNGVKTFFDILRSQGHDARALAGARIAAIGPKTSQALTQRGIRVDLMPEEYIGEKIARSLIDVTSQRDRVLIFRAQDARDVLPRALRDAARLVDVVAGYKTVILKDPGFGGKVERADILTFTSASTVRGFMENMGGLAGVATQGKTVACIGPVTAAAANTAGLRVDVVASEYTFEGLIEALQGAQGTTLVPSTD
ncbi:MAG: uroporphyrinogen-III C-methyltransferase [Candidatus Eremiobacteraeota bacterium]|nr:uroporphyrinogen-III C-methyltransferase [Candidatus Eremiobacteraeota bacterium]